MSEAFTKEADGEESKKLLYSPNFIMVLPVLVEALGGSRRLEAAVILQQFHFLLTNKRNGKVVNGKRWLYNTYTEWIEHFPWMTPITMKRTLTWLEKNGAIESCKPEGRMSRRKYYRLLIGWTAEH